MTINVSPDAKCLSCGYLLRGLDEPVCPECARAFDPGDLTTFNVDPRRRRRRRITRLIIALVAAGLALAALWPRGMHRAQITFTYATSGHSIQVKRWEPRPPPWVPFRYPGFRWTTRTPDSSPGTGLFSIGVSSKFADGRSMSMKTIPTDGSSLAINGILAVPENGAEILRLCTDGDDLRIQSSLIDPDEIGDDP